MNLQRDRRKEVNQQFNTTLDTLINLHPWWSGEGVDNGACNIIWLQGLQKKGWSLIKTRGGLVPSIEGLGSGYN